MAALLLAGPACAAVLACGPFFPNRFLDSGGDSILVAPATSFAGELRRMRLEPPEFKAVTNGATPADQALEAELRDLTNSLKKAGVPDNEAARICASHLAERDKLRAYLAGVAASDASRPIDWDEKAQKLVRGKPTVPPPLFPKITITRLLPDEFADYFKGAVAWDNPALTNKDVARDAWRDLLNLPAPDRHFKSTWAAFMLGKSLQKDDPARAIAYFKRVRDLSAHGFVDSTGLAAASLGLEAQTQLQQGKIADAVELYLDQFASGDKSAYESLRFGAAAALGKEDAEGLAALAANPKVQHVITAYLISHNRGEYSYDGNDARKKWLAAVEAAGARDVASAEEFALAAYQAGDWDAAQRWIDRAPDAPASQWLRAKLLLRSGKVDQAAALLTKVVALFPIQPRPTNAPALFQDDLTVEGFNDHTRDFDPYIPGASLNGIPASEQVLGELGALRLTRREYVEALDALWRSGFHDDAAYIADRVLTVDELKDYVDRNWPAESNDGIRADDGIRDLLARRLARLHRAAEARTYYSASLLPKADALAQALARGDNISLPALDRARALFAAARITATNGLDLLGTETAPDWHIQDGKFEEGVTAAGRTNDALLPASDDELRRAGQSAPDPDVRYTYRFLAAALAWRAALLMPDNSDETARVLSEAGTWIKVLDPKKADVFYKALVNRCRRTAIGAEADRKRWFPILDESGNLVPSGGPTVK